MPLSRLTARSGRKKLARQKPSRTKQADNQRHLQLWAAIRATREELDQWQRQIEQVDALFALHIEPRERKLTHAVCLVTAALIRHFAEDQLDMADQSLLGLWVTENLNALLEHPFGDAETIRKLNRQWLDLLNNDGPIEIQLAKLARRKHFSDAGTCDGHAEFTQDSSYHSEDLQTDSTKADAKPTRATDNENKKIHQTQESADADSPDTGSLSDESSVADTINTLEQKLSVERLFRQLAKVLHPDREPDEDAKAAKHVLMSECLKARQEKDINALLTLYCEHVGELPDDLNNNSHNELVDALERQLKELQLKLRQKRFGNPLHTMIVERYSASSAADCQKRIKSHAQSLDGEISSATSLEQQLSGPDGLVDALDERRSVEQDRMAINELTGYSS